MPYTLSDFCADLNQTIKEKGQSGLPDLAEKLSALLKNPDFVASAFSESDPIGKKELWHDPETDVYVLAHVQTPGRVGKPHSHGASWAIYGTARGYTDMTEWKRVNPEGEEAAQLLKSDSYRLNPGDTRAYGPHVIHSTAHPDGQPSWVIRITGTDLDKLPRYHFRPKTDRIFEHA
jgi:predicted metal-dependent enzyme (double-stranded beta helix superfamily)